MSILEIESPGKFVVLLIEGAAGNEDSNRHGSICAEPMQLGKFRIGDWHLRILLEGRSLSERRRVYEAKAMSSLT
jgi:hypothetical protein